MAEHLLQGRDVDEMGVVQREESLSKALAHRLRRMCRARGSWEGPHASWELIDMVLHG